MRVVLSLGTVVIVLWLASRLTGGQEAALATAPMASAASGSVPEQTASAVHKSIEQGAARRADDAALR